MKDTIKFGPRPEKLWVGMKGKTRIGELVELKDVDEDDSLGEYVKFVWTTSYGFQFSTSITGNYWNIGAFESDIVSWEQPTQEAPEELDWKAKYEQLRKHYEHLQADMQAQECAYNVLVQRRDSLQERNNRLMRELKEAQSELRDVYKAQEKLNRIVKIVHESDGEDWDECDD